MTKRIDVLPDRVALALQEQIVAERYLPGTVLPTERVLQEEHGVSRTVVREALKTLAARGLVTLNSGKGAIVKSDLTGAATDSLLLAFQRAKVFPEDILAVRTLFEPHVAELAAQNATQLQIREINELVSRLEELDFEADKATTVNNREIWGRLDPQFHILVAEASQNPVLTILMKVLLEIMWRQEVKDLSELSPTAIKKAKEQHRALAAAIQAHDDTKARTMAIEHLQSTKQSISNQPKNARRL